MKPTSFVASIIVVIVDVAHGLLAYWNVAPGVVGFKWLEEMQQHWRE